MAFEARIKRDSKLAEEVRLFSTMMLSIEAREIKKAIAEVVQTDKVSLSKPAGKRTIGVYPDSEVCDTAGGHINSGHLLF